MEELMLIENPYYYPTQRRSKGGKAVKRNPAGLSTVTKEWFQGVDMMDAGAALGGLAASTMIPGMIVKDTATTGKKLLKLVASLVSTAAAGFIFRNVSPSAGKMAIAGGLAGTLTQTLAMFTNITIGQPNTRYLAAPNRGIGQSVVPEFDEVRVN